MNFFKQATQKFLRLIPVILCLTMTASAAVPQLINYQGLLNNNLGVPVPNGSYSVTFTIYNAPAGGINYWTETQSVTTTNGLFSVLLGIGPIPLVDSIFNDTTRYLGITVGADPEMTPRQRLSTVGYSYNSSEWTSAGQDLFRLNGNVGIGSSTPSAKLEVTASGSVGIRATGGTTGVDATGGMQGVLGSGGTFGGRFIGTDGGSYGILASGVNYGIDASGGGTGVKAVSITGTGIFASGGTHGVYGVASTGSGYGVYGVAAPTGSGFAVFGDIGGNFGNYGGYFQGDVKVERNLVVTGSVSKGGGSFKIDHPLEPANKYLYHSFVESPDMKNIYDGVITTDAQGNAGVILPEWFETLNKDFRYQLTVIGEFAQAIISEKIKGNQFSIKTDKPNIEVSWQVTGIRQDAWANAHRIQVEEDKPVAERGKYLHPKENGVPEALGILYEMTQKLEEDRKQQEEQQAKMEAERRQHEEQQAKMEAERKLQQEQRVKMDPKH